MGLKWLIFLTSRLLHMWLIQDGWQTQIEVVAAFLTNFGARMNILFILKVMALLLNKWSNKVPPNHVHYWTQNGSHIPSRSFIFLEHFFFFFSYLFLERWCLITYHSNVGVPLRQGTKWWTFTFNQMPIFLSGVWVRCGSKTRHQKRHASKRD